MNRKKKTKSVFHVLSVNLVESTNLTVFIAELSYEYYFQRKFSISNYQPVLKRI